MRAVLESLAWAYGVLAACLVGMVGALVFLVSYQRRVGWTWWRFADGAPNPFGRFLMIWSWTRVGVLGLTVTNALLPPWPGQLPLSFLVMAAFALHTFVPYRLLRRVHPAPRPIPHEEEPMTTYSDDPTTAGPARDGSKSLARESKYGQAVTAILSILALGLAGWLGHLDLSTLPGWLVGSATVAASTFAGVLTAWATKNRPRALPLYRKG